MDKITWITLLFDFYGQLLTEKQRKFIDLYYLSDFSLGEIAENYGVSRQAVYDTVKRAEKILADYEGKLGLVARFLEQRNKLSQVAKLLQMPGDKNKSERIMQARKLLEEVLEMAGG